MSKKKFLIDSLFKVAKIEKRLMIDVLSAFRVIKQRYPEIPEDKLKELMNKYSYQDLVSKVKTHYENFSESEIEEMIKFFSSSIGRKLSDDLFLRKIVTTTSDWMNELTRECAILSENIK